MFQGHMDNDSSFNSFDYTSLNHTHTQSPVALLQWRDFLETHCQMALSVNRYVTPIWYVIGLTGNTLSARIWLQRRMCTNNSSAVYLAALSISDLAFLVLHLCMELQYAWFLPTLSYPVICEAYFLLYIALQYLSPTLVLGFTVERYIAVCHPFQKESLCRTGRAVRVVVAMTIACFLLSAIQSYFWTYDSELGECRVRTEATSQEGTMSLWSAWAWGSETVVFLVIPLIILSFNALVIRELRSVNRKEATMAKKPVSGCAATTAMLLSVSFYVIVTSLPATLVYVLEGKFSFSRVEEMLNEKNLNKSGHRYVVYLTTRSIVEELCLSHYACNFFLYLITGRQFRKSLVRLCSVQRSLSARKCNDTMRCMNGVQTSSRRQGQNTETDCSHLQQQPKPVLARMCSFIKM